MIRYRRILACKAPLLEAASQVRHSPAVEDFSVVQRQAEEALEAFTLQMNLKDSAEQKSWSSTTSRRRALRESQGRIKRKL